MNKLERLFLRTGFFTIWIFIVGAILDAPFLWAGLAVLSYFIINILDIFI